MNLQIWNWISNHKELKVGKRIRSDIELEVTNQN